MTIRFPLKKVTIFRFFLLLVSALGRFKQWHHNLGLLQLRPRRTQPNVMQHCGLCARSCGLEIISIQVSNEEKGPWLLGVYTGDDIQPSYVGIVINPRRIQDAYQTQPVQWKVKSFFFVAHLLTATPPKTNYHGKLEKTPNFYQELNLQTVGFALSC